MPIRSRIKILDSSNPRVKSSLGDLHMPRMLGFGPAFVQCQMSKYHSTFSNQLPPKHYTELCVVRVEIWVSGSNWWYRLNLLRKALKKSLALVQTARRFCCHVFLSEGAKQDGKLIATSGSLQESEDYSSSLFQTRRQLFLFHPCYKIDSLFFYICVWPCTVASFSRMNAHGEI